MQISISSLVDLWRKSSCVTQCTRICFLASGRCLTHSTCVSACASDNNSLKGQKGYHLYVHRQLESCYLQKKEQINKTIYKFIVLIRMVNTNISLSFSSKLGLFNSITCKGGGGVK